MRLRHSGEDQQAVVMTVESREEHEPEVVRKAFEQLVYRKKVRRVVVDLAALTDPKSAMLGTLVGGHTIAQLEGARVSFFGAGKQTRYLLEVLGLDSVIDLQPDLDAALRSVRSGASPVGSAEEPA